MAMNKGSERMNQIHSVNSIDLAEQPHELWNLVRKLRWMGMEEEADRLQLRMRGMSPEQGTVPSETFGTD